MTSAGLADLILLGYCDLGGVVRARAIPVATLPARLRTGLGWVPANQAMMALGHVAEPNEFGSLGDVRIRPDQAARVALADDPSATHFELILCDAVELDGSPWQACPRAFLRGALARLERELGAHLLASFEHEFFLLGDRLTGSAFAIQAHISCEPFASVVMQALADAGLAPETFIAEYGPGQYEIPCAPVPGLAAADHSVLLKELVRECARRTGLRASFTPQLDPAETGSGAHIHLSLLDGDDRPLLADPGAPGRLSRLGQSFAAGLLAHAPSLVALGAPSPVSYFRLQPHRWSAASVVLASGDREALVRIPPVVGLSDVDPARQLNLEFRAGDATANPYLLLGALIHAGLDGIRDGLRAPQADAAPSAPPSSLAAALDALESDPAPATWMPALLLSTFLTVKRAEVDAAAGVDEAELLARYADVY